MIVEAVGISVNGFYGKDKNAKDGKDMVQRAMEQAVHDVLALGINDPDERARLTREAVAEARAKAKKLRREIDAAVNAAINDALKQPFATAIQRQRVLTDAAQSAAAAVMAKHKQDH